MISVCVGIVMLSSSVKVVVVVNRLRGFIVIFLD